MASGKNICKSIWSSDSEAEDLDDQNKQNESKQQIEKDKEDSIKDKSPFSTLQIELKNDEESIELTRAMKDKISHICRKFNARVYFPKKNNTKDQEEEEEVTYITLSHKNSSQLSALKMKIAPILGLPGKYTIKRSNSNIVKLGVYNPAKARNHKPMASITVNQTNFHFNVLIPFFDNLI